MGQFGKRVSRLEQHSLPSKRKKFVVITYTTPEELSNKRKELEEEGGADCILLLPKLNPRPGLPSDELNRDALIKN